MKRLELGRLSADGAFGLRVSAPGHDVGNPNARLLFDTNTPLAAALMKTAISVGYTRQVLQVTPPYGLEGTRTTVFRHTSSWTFPTPLPWAPVCVIGYTTNINGTVRSFDVNCAQDQSYLVEYESSATGVTVFITEGVVGDVNYSANPIHRITVLNVARP